MIWFGKIALALWALAMGYVGYLLVNGQMGVAMTAIENDRMSDAITQFIFIALVFAGTAIACGLFVVVGIFRE